MKREYTTPSLVEYGRIGDLTLGAKGPLKDYVIVGANFVPDVNAPTCDNNVISSFRGCIHT